MEVRQNANCSIAIRRFDNGEAVEFVKDTIIDLDETTANYLLEMKIFSDGKTTDPDGKLIPEGDLCSDFSIEL